MRRSLYFAGTLAAVVATVYLLARMGAPGWFTLTFGLVLAGVTIVFFWGVFLVAGIAVLLFRLAMHRAAKAQR